MRFGNLQVLVQRLCFYSAGERQKLDLDSRHAMMIYISYNAVMS